MWKKLNILLIVFKNPKLLRSYDFGSFLAFIIFGATIDESMVDEVKITVIATGFTANSESDTNSDEVKPILSVKLDMDKKEENVLPLLREMEEAEKRAQEVEEQKIEPIEEVMISDPVVAKMEEELATEPDAKKSRELPAFMRKLFKK